MQNDGGSSLGIDALSKDVRLLDEDLTLDAIVIPLQALI